MGILIQKASIDQWKMPKNGIWSPPVDQNLYIQLIITNFLKRQLVTVNFKITWRLFMNVAFNDTCRQDHLKLDRIAVMKKKYHCPLCGDYLFKGSVNKLNMTCPHCNRFFRLDEK